MQHLIGNETTRSRISQIEMQRKQYFEKLTDDQSAHPPRWLTSLQRVGLGSKLFLSKQTTYAKYALTTDALRSFQASTAKWAITDHTTWNDDVHLINHLLTRVPLFNVGTFGITNETLPLYNATMIDIIKAYIVESKQMSEILRTNNIGTRIDRTNLVEVIQAHWTGFKINKKALNH